jgi:hypothetical protein
MITERSLSFDSALASGTSCRPVLYDIPCGMWGQFMTSWASTAALSTSRMARGALWLAFLMFVGGPATAKPVDDAISPAPAWSCAGKARDAKGFRELAACEARQLGLPPQFATAVMEIESGFNPGAKGAAGEIGLMQVMPPTARLLGFRGDADQLADPAINIALGVRYLAKAHRLAGGDLCTTVMKYRAGHRETRFSARSIAYCLRARKIFNRDGYKVTGAVPVATIGLADDISEPRPDKRAGHTGFCIRKIFVPPPVFRKCVEYRKIRHLPPHPKS